MISHGMMQHICIYIYLLMIQNNSLPNDKIWSNDDMISYDMKWYEMIWNHVAYTYSNNMQYYGSTYHMSVIRFMKRFWFSTLFQVHCVTHWALHVPPMLCNRMTFMWFMCILFDRFCQRASLPWNIDLQEIGDGQACTGDILESEACLTVWPHRYQALEKTGTWKALNVKSALFFPKGFKSAGVQFRALPCGLQAQWLGWVDWMQALLRRHYEQELGKNGLHVSNVGDCRGDVNLGWFGR